MNYEPIPGQPQHTSEEETMSIIRAVLTEAEDPKPTRRAARKAKRNAAQAKGDSVDDQKTQSMFGAFDPRSKDRTLRRRAEDLPDLMDAVQEPPKAKRASIFAKLGNALRGVSMPVLGRLAAFRPSTRHLAMACLALLVVLRPHWFVMTSVLIVAVLAGMFLILGSERVWHGVVSYLASVDARDPDRAVRLRARLDRFACVWDGILDRFPDGMVDTLYMPDMQAIQKAEAANMDAMSERLARMAQDT